ncbi:hypothetical protein PWT90_11086 [Aphanocladium album]|nr:hypothetical protein PWT90_11086 [Aphanocladium album]
MKTSTLAIASLTPSACIAGIGHSWSFDGSPTGGMQDVTFGFDVSRAAHRRGYYFANQFKFQNVDSHIGGTKWRGTLRNARTGQSVVICEYVLPAGAGGIRNSQVGFLEYFLANGNSNFKCSDQFKTEVSYYYPTSNTAGAGTGKIPRPYEYGSCKGEQDFATTAGSNYWTINSGF